MFIRYDNERLPEMSRLASLRQLRFDRTTGERAEVQVYKVSSHSRPGHWHTVLLYDKEGKASCTCPATDACSHIAIALSDYRPHFISEWAADGQAGHLTDVLEAERAAIRGHFKGLAKQKVKEYRERMAAYRAANPPVPYACPDYLMVPAEERAEVK